METYEQMKKRHQEEFNKFPLGAAFSDEQFNKMMENWGLAPTDVDKIYQVAVGMFVRKCDSKALSSLIERTNREMVEAMKDVTFFYEAALYEMCNHEYAINMQRDYDVINALGFDVEYSDGGEIADAPFSDEQRAAYLKARKEYYRLAEENEWY